MGLSLIPYCIGVDVLGFPIYIQHYLFSTTIPSIPYSPNKSLKGKVKTKYYKTQHK